MTRVADSEADLLAAGRSEMPARLAWPDFAKAIGIILVVVCHTADGVFGALSRQRPPAWNEFINLSYAFMVPVFFFVAGWLAERSSASSSIGVRLLQVARNILWPYVLWTLLQSSLMILTQAGNDVPRWSDLPRFLLVGALQFWFLRALIIAFVIDFGLRRAGVPPAGRTIIGMALLVFFSLFPDFGGAGTSIPALHYIYFAAGAWVHRGGLRMPGTHNLVGVAGAGAVLLVTFHFAGLQCDTSWRPLTAFAGVAACIAISALLPAAAYSALLRLIGIHSLAIYCMHVIVAAAARIAMLKTGVRDANTVILVGSVAAILVPLAVACWGGKWLGFLFRFPVRTRAHS